MNEKINDIPEKMSKLAKEFDACREAFIALGDENRQHIIIALLENHSGMRVGEITKRTNLSRPAVSHHLKVLKDAGIVNVLKKGTMNFYHVDANESQWSQITSLITQINELVQKVSKSKQCFIYSDD